MGEERTSLLDLLTVLTPLKRAMIVVLTAKGDFSQLGRHRHRRPWLDHRADAAQPGRAYRQDHSGCF